MYEQQRAICEELGDRAEVARACSGLGNCFNGMGYFAQSREMHEQHKAICEELGGRAGVAIACANLGNCSLSTGEYATVITFYKTWHAIATELPLQWIPPRLGRMLRRTTGGGARRSRSTTESAPSCHRILKG